MNKVILSGRLTADPDVRYTQEQKAYARFSLAVDRAGAREKTADFISCLAWDRSAEFAEKYLSKGMKIIVVGHIQTGSYTNKDGRKVYTTDVVIENIEFCESKKKDEPEEETQMAAMPEIDEELPFN